jgi:hypothetical protein
MAPVTADGNLFGWMSFDGERPGLLETLRVLDLGDNWELAEANITAAMGNLLLWEL